MVEDPPRVYILHGNDEFAIGLSVSDIESKVGDESLAALNTSRIDGRSSGLEDLRLVLGTVPFFVTRRLVIVNDLLARLVSPELREKFIEVLDSVPGSTALVLIEHYVMKEDHWLLAWARKSGSRAYVRLHQKVMGGGMVNWIENQAVQMGGKISRPAAVLLASLVGDETRVAFHELQKLLAYLGYQGMIEIEDVETQVLSISQADIFEFVDAIGNRDNRRAMGVLRRLYETNEQTQIFYMIVRQIRLVLLAKEILSEGKREQDVAQVLQLFRFVARKLTRQAGNFTTESLEEMYRDLLEIDSAVKVGRQEWDVAMECLVAALN